MRITISGFPGAGKGTLRKMLSEEYNIPSFSVGDLRREYASTLGMEIQDFNKLSEKEPIWDIKADEYQKEWGKEKEFFILEGRLSYHFFPESIRIFLEVDEKTGAERIIYANRSSEKKCSLDEQIIANKKRCESDIERYSKIYGIKNCYDENQFDIIADTTERNPEQMLNLIKKKIIDYNQKMNPLTFYIGHPTRLKGDKEFLKRLEEFSGKFNLKFFNPFIDNKAEKENSLGEKSYKDFAEEEANAMAEGDLIGILDKKVIGGIFFYNGDFTVGTQMESLTAFLAGKLNLIVTPKGEKEFLRYHPFFRYLKTEIFPDFEDMEKYFSKNRNDLFIKLREVRERWNKNPITKKLYHEMMKNKVYLGR
ncbi:MAG: AAA family ATPase [Candidatus Pacearchaeota archaeon]|nr:AAA family ATPase [Candidatus Pacearchaeota archaeon]